MKKEQHTPKVVAPWQKSNFVNNDLVPRGYGGCSLAWPRGQRTPTCYLAQHLELVVGISEALWAAAQVEDRASKLATDRSRCAGPRRVTQAASSQEYQNIEMIKKGGSKQLCLWYTLPRRHQTNDVNVYLQ